MDTTTLMLMVWAVVAGALLLSEVLGTTFIFGYFGLSALAALVAAAAGAGVIVQVAVFAGAGLVALALTRTYLKERFGGPPPSADHVVGKQGTVTVAVSRSHPGQVRVDGELWRAVTAAAEQGTITSGTAVVVESVDGLTVTVRTLAAAGDRRS